MTVAYKIYNTVYYYVYKMYDYVRIFITFFSITDLNT